jgi:hypothetical protein
MLDRYVTLRQEVAHCQRAGDGHNRRHRREVHRRRDAESHHRRADERARHSADAEPGVEARHDRPPELLLDG